MNCAGCDMPMSPDSVAAYAIMSQEDLDRLEIAPDILGSGRFHAVGICQECYYHPSHRTRQLKAHFSMPADVEQMVGHAGASSIG